MYVNITVKEIEILSFVLNEKSVFLSWRRFWGVCKTENLPEPPGTQRNLAGTPRKLNRKPN